jgi:hypothetical protein
MFFWRSRQREEAKKFDLRLPFRDSFFLTTTSKSLLSLCTAVLSLCWANVCKRQQIRHLLVFVRQSVGEAGENERSG